MSQTKDDAEGFTVGATSHPIVDSRDLPAVTPEQEEAFLREQAAHTDHPDDSEDTVEEPDIPEDNGGDDAVAEDTSELDALIADIDPHEHGGDGFDESDEPIAPEEQSR